ncbi:MAG: hypothetical protein KTR25_02335 [Myxococcales bacterium]|nr:hypothetical protein [Myxococcales bacterium]
MQVTDLVRAGRYLRPYVADIDVTHPPPEGQPLSNAISSGWCVVSGQAELSCQALLVHGAIDIQVKGPTGRITAELTQYNLNQRWAKIRTHKSVTTIGLLPARPSPETERVSGMDIFALVHTEPNAGVLAGVLLDMDPLNESEGYIRSDLQLKKGMPVFDKHLRWLGISRSSVWDKDRTLLIPPEMTTNSTVSITVSSPPTTPPKPNSRPWWAK